MLRLFRDERRVDDTVCEEHIQLCVATLHKYNISKFMRLKCEENINDI